MIFWAVDRDISRVIAVDRKLSRILTLAPISAIGEICWADAETLALLDGFSPRIFGKEIAVASAFRCHGFSKREI